MNYFYGLLTLFLAIFVNAATLCNADEVNETILKPH